MFPAKWFNYILLLKRLTFTLLLFQISRLAFLFVNPSTYNGEFLPVLLAGIRYDITAIFILNSLVVVLHLYHGKYQYNSLYQLFISFISIFINALALLFNLIDTAWFSFIQKRSTADIFGFIMGGDDVSNNLPQYLLDYWYLLLLWLLMVSGQFIFEKKIRKEIAIKLKSGPVFFNIPVRILLFFFFAGISVIGFRGGIQLKPLSVQTAAKLVPSASIPLVLNTPYTIIKSWNDQLLAEPDFMSMNQANDLLPVHFDSKSDSAFRPYNVVLIIMESFSFEHISYYNPGKNTTPFFDSLLLNTISFPNTFANAKRSIEGIPAVITSLPALMDQPFINSAYNVNKINSLASLLKPLGVPFRIFSWR
jgi:glucan phosphoethanolaminetransferase (alkaline phosphatase superfamily)